MSAIIKMSGCKEDEEFNAIHFEKRLSTLKDSQDAINACCKWCLENRQHHKKIVNCWLNVLKRVKIEQRVNLFYLANDVIQYSKRRNYDFVESWGTALQKATTLVRDDKVKHKIIRIFNIWEQRGVYNDEFISDLCGLISVVPTAPKNDEPHEFQASYVIHKIKNCSKLENETDYKLKLLKEHNPKLQLDTEILFSNLKDRAHLDDVEKELDIYVKHLEGYIDALKAEIKCRITNISVLKQASTHLDKDKRDVKVIGNAYKTFGQKIKIFQKKLEERKISLTSPIPSPDVNAPSPSPDSDLDLPEDEIDSHHETKKQKLYNLTERSSYNNYNYYNPIPSAASSSPSSSSNNNNNNNNVSTNFDTNGFSSFIGTNFNLQNLGTTLFTNTQATTENPNYSMNPNVLPPPPPVEAPNLTTPTAGTTPYQTGHLPLLPPPMPPFSSNESVYNTYNEKCSFDDGTTGFVVPPPPLPTDVHLYEPSHQLQSHEYCDNNFDLPLNSNPYPSQTASGLDEYNPEQEPDTWVDMESGWNQSSLDIDTPESPPLFEKEDTIRGRGKDVDHRNLISLTGSPADPNTDTVPIDMWNEKCDQDYHNISHQQDIIEDKDYRIPPFNIEQLKLPPPPPPSSSSSTTIAATKLSSSPSSSSSSLLNKKYQDNVESIDMELSEDEIDYDNKKLSSSSSSLLLIPPPPLPDLPDDTNANNFLDDLNNDLNSNEFTTNLSGELIINEHELQYTNNIQTTLIVPSTNQNWSTTTTNNNNNSNNYRSNRNNRNFSKRTGRNRGRNGSGSTGLGGNGGVNYNNNNKVNNFRG